MTRRIIFALCIIAPLALYLSCSRDIGSYDELSREGQVESTVRKTYSAFFREIDRLAAAAGKGDAAIDSTLISRAASSTDGVVAVMRDFPRTVESRLALDALSYAAGDLTPVTRTACEEVYLFREGALIDPILTKGREYIMSGEVNESTHLQLVRSLKRGIGARATNDLLLELIPLVGPAPADTIMQVCFEDSLIFRRIHDLIVYSRSLQVFGPPAWLMTGPFLMAVETEGFPLNVFGLKTELIHDRVYLSFKTFDLGTFYAAVFDDPIPDDPEKSDAWLLRASKVMNDLTFDQTIAERILKTDLPMYDTHNIYNDYLIYTDADTTSMDFFLTLKKDRIETAPFEYDGIDSLTVTFDIDRIGEPDGIITELPATRFRGASMLNGRGQPARQASGTAYIIPFGTHDKSILEEHRQRLMPKVEVNTR